MNSPVLTIITPTYKRPVGLKMCRASVMGQHRSDEIQHLIVPDEVGLGVGGMYASLPSHNGEIEGRWTYVLSDDDVLVYPRIVDLIERVEAENSDAAVIMVRMFCNGKVLPADFCWHAPPQCGYVTLSNWIVKTEAHIAYPFGHRYEGDFDQADALYRAGLTFAWADILVAASQAGANNGRPE